MDISHRQSGFHLPAMNDGADVKRPEAGYTHHHSASHQIPSSHHGSNPTQPPYAPLPSYAPQPVHSVSNLLSSNSSHGPDTRKYITAPARQGGQSLPSIHEALAAKDTLPYPSYYEPSPLPSSPNSARKMRPYGREMEYDGALRGVPQEHGQFRAPAMASNGQVSSTTVLPTLPAPAAPPSGPVQQQESSLSWAPWERRPSAYEQQAQEAIPSTPDGSYLHYPQYYVQPVGPIAAPHAAQYARGPSRALEPQLVPGPEQRAPQQDKVERSGSVFGNSVKRHLENFDLESSLNQIAESGRALLDFSDYYSQRAHETQRSGPLPGSTPHLSEVDEMIRCNGRIHESLSRLHEVIATQQAVIMERSKERQEKVAAVEPENTDVVGVKSTGVRKASGFAGSDPKKPKRGKAAAPGRCHSCNRGETPEWRRGPDGARTLCNACGLHYAKLTRKLGAKAALASSNLRPKSPGPGRETA